MSKPKVRSPVLVGMPILEMILWLVVGGSSHESFFSESLVPFFVWNVTPFMTTIGGWCLGNAWSPFFSARQYVWKIVYVRLGTVRTICEGTGLLWSQV